jgi:hypothetical protein
MSIVSNAFGRVTLTDKDAEKFTRQMNYGRPKVAAVENVRRGLEMSKTFTETGFVKITTKAHPVR